MASVSASASRPGPQASQGLSPNAEFLYSGVLIGAQKNAEATRRFFPMLRQWASSKKSYRGRTFSPAEVEEAIAAYERHIAALTAPPSSTISTSSTSSVQPPSSTSSSAASSAAASSASSNATTTGATAPTTLTSPKEAEATPRLIRGESTEGVDLSGTKASGTQRAPEGWWPRWALDRRRGVEVLAPVIRGKPPSWVPATPVAIGYHGQKKKFLFVRASGFEMDCRRSEVRPPGGGRTAQELAEELVARGDDPARHPDWTDHSDEVKDSKGGASEEMLIAPGVAPAGSSNADMDEKPTLTGASGFLDELEGEFERMALLRRSPLVKTPTCDHPDPLSEPRSAASIRLPRLTEKDVLALPPHVAQERLSSLQLETVCFAARRFRMTLPDGRTAGYVLGDGTGCGKGRVISALLYHMWNCGHRRSVWVSATSDLYFDACRDLQDLGADIPCMMLRKLPPSGPLDRKGSESHKELVRNFGVEGNGVIFLTYSLLVQTGQRREVFPVPVRTQEARNQLLGELLDDRMRVVATTEFGDDKGTVLLRAGDRVVGMPNLRQLQGMEVPFTVSMERVLQRKGGEKKPGLEEDTGAELTAWNSRLGQLVAWLGGTEATGLICFDEVHKAKNLVPDKADTASTKTGLFVDLLQQHCPKAPVLYVSATAATEVQHLGYMSRLGVWGQGTAFDNFHDFMKTIEANGVAAMEMFAINMKAIGALSCRALAYVGTEFSTQQCGLTQQQLETYNAACRFWQKMLISFRRFVESKELRDIYRNKYHFKKKKDGDDEDEQDELGKRLWQFFWGAQQRFFKAMCNAAKVPAACAAAQEAMERGEQVVMSIWATGEARSSARMARMKDETPGRVIVESISDGSLVEVEIKEADTLEKIAGCLLANLRLKSDVTVGGKAIGRMSLLKEVHGRRIQRPEDLLGATLPVKLIFRRPIAGRLAVDAKVAASGEPVSFELADDALGERVVVAKVLDGPASFRRAELEGWHIKTIGNRPIGKTRVQQVRTRLRRGVPVAFQDAVIPEHLSGPQMILEHFLTTSLITEDVQGNEIPWAKEAKDELMEEMRSLQLPANAMDEIVDYLGGLRKVAEMSGRSHRMKRRKDGSLAYVARCEELRCKADGANMVEQVLFQKGSKKVCLVTEVASAGISLHADRRQVRKDFQPPRRTMISVELPWGADKAIQCFGRVHRANQLVPPRFIMLCTPLGGEVRFISAIARRMKLLGAVTKGDRMASMGGGADRHMADFDVNNVYGVRALATFYMDTNRPHGMLPELIDVYRGLSCIAQEGEEEAEGRWAKWEDFAHEARRIWYNLNLKEELDMMITDFKDKGHGTSENAAVNRFFNRILMLEVHLQNALFEAFFAVYSELVRVDRANGVFDDGVENLNMSQGRVVRQIEVDHREVLCTDPVSGAETHYIRLRLDRGISWEAAKEAYDALRRDAGSVEGFYAYRSKPDAEPIYMLVKEREQVGGAGSSGATWMTRRRRKQYFVWRADNGVQGAGSGLDGFKYAFSEEDLQSEAYERVGGSETELEAVEEAWTQLYESSAQKRLAFEHLLAGDVLSAWRLVSGRGGGQGPKLRVVRAVTQGGEPVVGMRIVEEDLPNLRYVLSCQHQSAADDADKAAKRPSARAVTLAAAAALLEKIRASGEEGLAVPSWLEAHKMLAEEGPMVPRTVEGLRGVQLAVSLLVRRRLVFSTDGRLTLKSQDAPIPVDEALEAALFPEEFMGYEEIGEGEKKGKKKMEDDEDDDDEEEEASEDDDDDAGSGADDAANDSDGGSEKNFGKSAPSSTKKRRPDLESVAAVATPAKAPRRASTASTGSAVRRARTTELDVDEEAAGTFGITEDDIFDALFADDDDADASPAKSRGEEPVSDPPTSAKKRRMVEASPAKVAQTPRWTYEVIGNKLGIRNGPDVTLGGDAGYLPSGSVFGVEERVEGADGRTYLRLADGRGWVYDRSAKDVNKVVVKEIVT